ncbi:M23 family metallopeptidase [Streptomyces sp. ST2-7A]|uniref:M23 family metallopeptidase n=1 Tax=Streptomyces sp. ST2-7A TaxID=2907214 RepID=UPI001F2B0E2E|nr:M23 family metallopeptidase [Streptomyces sp. ST2-7A]MCE7081964.1 M23 family metallopeptidase [Streptomyces sp. ST2-7A]
MPSTTAIRAPRLRTRAALLAAGVGFSAVLASGGGVAAAAGPTGGDLFAAGTPDTLARYTLGLAEVHQKAAEAEAKAAVEAQKAAEAKAAAEAKKAAEAAEAKKAAEAEAKAAEAKKAASWVAPISGGYTISATYGNSGNRWAAGHSGQDFAVPTGTPVLAVHGGTVVKAGGNGAGDGPAYGNAVVIKHDDGSYSQYAHLSQVQVSSGQRVETGSQIALSGNTGNSSGPHLHFEIRTTPNYGSSVDPSSYLRGKGVNL